MQVTRFLMCQSGHFLFNSVSQSQIIVYFLSTEFNWLMNEKMFLFENEYLKPRLVLEALG